MKLGDIVLGADGTAYVVVRIADVRRDQLRWWVDARWARAHSDEYEGPETIADLHLLPACACGEIKFALVPPS